MRNPAVSVCLLGSLFAKAAAQGRTWLVNTKKLTAYDFVNSEVIWILVSAVICLCLFSFVRFYSSIVCPRGLDCFRDLELDDTPDRQFDGIDNALFERLRDPWNYRPVPHVSFEEPAKNAEEIKREETAKSVREAAEKLRQYTNRTSAESTAVAAPSGAVRRNSKFVTAAEKRSEELANQLTAVEQGGGQSVGSTVGGVSKSKWAIWDEIADGRHSGAVGSSGQGGSADDFATSGRSDSSAETHRSNLSVASAHRKELPLVSLKASIGVVGSMDTRFASRGAASTYAPSVGTTSAGNGGSQWTSRAGLTPASTPAAIAPSTLTGKASLPKLDLSAVKVAPPGIKAPQPPVNQGMGQEHHSLKLYDPADDDDNDGYAIDSLQPSVSLQLQRPGPGMMAARPMIVPPRLGPPPGAPPRGFATPGPGPGPGPGRGPGLFSGRGPPPRAVGPGALAILGRPPGMGFLAADPPPRGSRPPPSSGPVSFQYPRGVTPPRG